MRYSRPVRLIFGIIILIAFGWYSARWMSNSVMSNDVGKPQSQPAAETPVSEQTQSSQPAEVVPVPAAEPTPAPAPEATPRPEELRAAQLGLPAPPAINIHDWQYVLVNGDHPIDPLYYQPETLAYLNMVGDDTDIRTEFDPNRQMVDIMIAQPLVDMTQACRAAGLPVYLSSGFRDYGSQQANFERVCANNGISDGKNAEGNYITMPAGCSEHQTGLCIDITDVYHEIKNDAIAEVATVQWLAQHCAEYGFILRFPTEKRSITHVMGESWHFRYVGEEAARYMTDNNLCLEEFVALYGVA